MPSEARLKKIEKYVKGNMLFAVINTVKNIFPCVLKNSPCVTAKFPVFSLSGKSENQIPCFPCAVATLNVSMLEPELDDEPL